jgi:adenylylsulfate kinase
MNINSNTIWHKGLISKRERNLLNHHDSGVIWFTGLSASGKSTIAHHIEESLFRDGKKAYVFDGDNIRHGLNANLGFSEDDRKENIRRIVEVAKLFVDAGIIVLAAFITPLEEQRIFVRNAFKGLKYVEVYVQCSIEECIRRDPKGLYKKAQQGIISQYTGISSPFEIPEKPDLILHTRKLSINESVFTVLNHLQKINFFNLS